MSILGRRTALAAAHQCIRTIYKSKKIMTLFVGTGFCFAFAHAVHAEAANAIFDKLEKGEVVAEKAGSSFTVQALINAEPAKVQKAFSDLTQLPKILSNVAFVRSYVTSDKRHLLWIKLRNLHDGLGVLVEVKQGGDESFANAFALQASASSMKFRDTANEANLNTPDETKVLLTDESQTKPEQQRSVSVSPAFVIEGPLNKLIQFPNTRVVAAFGIGSYNVTPGAPAQTAPIAPATNAKGAAATAANMKTVVAPAPAALAKTILISRVSFGNQIVYGVDNTFGGFGDRELNIAMRLGVNLFGVLQGRLEKI